MSKWNKLCKRGLAYVVVNAELNILTSLLLFFDETSGQAPTPGINNVAALLSLDRRMET